MLETFSGSSILMFPPARGRVDSEMLGQQSRADGEMRTGRGPGGSTGVTTNRVEIEKERLGLSGTMGPHRVSPVSPQWG